MSATHPPEQPMPSAMTDRELAPCPHCGSSPSDLTTAYLAGVHHDGTCKRHECKRVRTEMQAEIDRMRADSARLDYIEHTFSGMTNRERYLPVKMIWGAGANGRTLREACDKHMARDAAMRGEGATDG